jgi:RNA polymerase sigma-70 factor (ECF subfamily)
VPRFSKLQNNRSLAKKSAEMEQAGSVFTEEALQKEWGEIQAAQVDPACFAPLYERYYEAIFRFVFRRTADEQLCADLCAQVFLKAMEKIHAYQYKGVPFSAWLYRIAMNEVAMYFRKVKKNRMVSLEEADLTALFQADESGEQFPAELKLTRMIEALDQLKEKDLQLIELRFFERRPYKEVAEILEISIANAKVRVHRLLSRLKKKIDR